MAEPNPEYALGEIRANLAHISSSIDEIKELNVRLHNVESDLKVLSNKVSSLETAVQESKVPMRVHIATWSGLLSVIIAASAVLKMMVGS